MHDILDQLVKIRHMSKFGEWRKDRDEGGFVHWLPIEDQGDGEEYFMKVEKSRGGDYTVTAYREGDPAGGEVDYRSTLRLAKKEAERLVADNEWRDYLSEDSSTS